MGGCECCWLVFETDRQIKGPLGIENNMLGYVYLVDAQCKIRWAGCGMASEEETTNLRRATAVLMGRMTGKTVEA